MGSSPEEYTEIRRELVAQYAAWRESAPDNPVLPYIQAKLTDDKKKSAELFRLATRIDSGFAAAWYELGVASEYFADFDGAVQHFRRAAAADPSMIEALRRIAYLRRHGDWRVYREDTEAVVAALVARSESGDSASAAALIADLAALAPTPTERIELYRRAIELESTNPNAYRGLYLELRNDDPGAASSILREVIEKSGGSLQVDRWLDYYRRHMLLELGRTLRMAGESKVAVGYLGDALGDPSSRWIGDEIYRETQVELALATEALGDTTRAMGRLLDLLEEVEDPRARSEYVRISRSQGLSEKEIAAAVWKRRLKNVRPMSDFALLDIDGDTVRLADYEGRVLLVTFWFPGCSPCRQELPYLGSLARNLAPRGLKVVTINGVPEENGDVATVLRNYGFPLDGLLAPYKEWAEEEHGVVAYPSNFVVSPDGKIIAGPEPGGFIGGPVINDPTTQAALERWLNSYLDYLELVGTGTGA